MGFRTNIYQTPITCVSDELCANAPTPMHDQHDASFRAIVSKKKGTNATKLTVDVGKVAEIEVDDKDHGTVEDDKCRVVPRREMRGAALDPDPGVRCG